MRASRLGHADVAAALLEGGAEVDERGQTGTRATPLVIAAHANRTEVARRLLEFDADVSAANRGGVTALMHAAYHGNPEFTRLLLERGADVDAANDEGNTPLLFAVLRDHPEVVALLADRGADLERMTRLGGIGRVNALMLAVGGKRVEAARILLDHGARVDTENRLEGPGDMRPLSLAARIGSAELVRILLDHGADPTWIDREGKTALERAREAGHDEIVELLAPGSETDAGKEQGASGDRTGGARVSFERSAFSPRAPTGRPASPSACEVAGGPGCPFLDVRPLASSR
jgi:ankyrin repeat protein